MTSVLLTVHGEVKWSNALWVRLVEGKPRGSISLIIFLVFDNVRCNCFVCLHQIQKDAVESLHILPHACVG